MYTSSNILTRKPTKSAHGGVGEIGLAGITAAVHHATGVRVRELPVRIEDLLV